MSFELMFETNEPGGTSGNIVANSVVLDPEDYHLYVAGYHFGYTNGNNDNMILNYDSFGEITWVSMFGGLVDDHLISIQISPDSSLYTCGVTYSAALKITTMYKIDKNDGGILIQKEWDPSHEN